MKNDNSSIPIGLLDAIKNFPVKRPVSHCGRTFDVPVFDIYATCPECGSRIKIRSFTAVEDIEDVFDAVFEWSLKSGAIEAMHRRTSEIADDLD